MSIIDNIRIKQDWTEEGYQFTVIPELDADSYFEPPAGSRSDEQDDDAIVLCGIVDGTIQKGLRKLLTKARERAYGYGTRNWDVPDEQGANLAPDLECRILLDMETRSQACMDPGADGDGVLCYSYKVGDGPVTVKHVADWTATGRYRK